MAASLFTARDLTFCVGTGGRSRRTLRGTSWTTWSGSRMQYRFWRCWCPEKSIWVVEIAGWRDAEDGAFTRVNEHRPVSLVSVVLGVLSSLSSPASLSEEGIGVER